MAKLERTGKRKRRQCIIPAGTFYNPGMRLAFQEIVETRRSNPKVDDCRMAAYVIAIEKISRSYRDTGY